MDVSLNGNIKDTQLGFRAVVMDSKGLFLSHGEITYQIVENHSCSMVHFSAVVLMLLSLGVSPQQR